VGSTDGISASASCSIALASSIRLRFIAATIANASTAAR
jgi:hypothetical protein